MKSAIDTKRLHCDDTGVAEAARILIGGGLVAMPTETVYGLAADATNAIAVARIFEAKGRPRFNPLIVHVADLETARRLVEFPPEAEKLAAAFWPGPLTMVLRRKDPSPVSDLVSAGLSTLAIRMPGHEAARRLIAAAGRPLAAPSANRSGHVSPTTPEHVAFDLGGRIDAILDAGAASVGVESTVLDLSDLDTTGPALLRPGGIARADLEACLGAPLTVAAGDAEADGDAVAPRSPGQLASHYAPRSRLRLGVDEPEPGEALLAFGPRVPPHTSAMINLSPSGNLLEAAAGLFSALRALDAEGCRSIAVMPIPAEGLGEAINDRLLRAAAPRS